VSADGVILAPVNLRGDVSVYLTNFEIETKDGAVTPIEREGHRYVFSHTLATGGHWADSYSTAVKPSLYVFVEAAN